MASTCHSLKLRVERTAAMPGGAERDALRRHRGIGRRSVVGGDQLRHIDQQRLRCRLAGQWTDAVLIAPLGLPPLPRHRSSAMQLSSSMILAKAARLHAGVRPPALHRRRPAGEFREHRFGITPVGRHILSPCRVGEGEQRLLGHRVDGVRRRQRFDVKRVRSCGILGAGAGPQQALRPRAGGGQFLPARRCQQFAVGP